MVFTILIAGVSAETYINGQQVDDTVTVFDFLGSIFNPTPFSIVGDNRLCGSGTDRVPNKQISKSVTSNTELNYDCGNAGCSNCLIQVFKSSKALGEYKDNVDIVIAIQSGTTANYRFDFYCCPHPECSSNSNCVSWYGSGSECIRATANDANIYYESSHYHYCSNTGDKASCYYLPSGNSNCVLKEYPGQDTCPASYSGMKLFSSESACNSQSTITSCSQITEDDTGKKLKVSEICSTEGTYKCIDSDLYVCTDFKSNLGKCWYGGYASSAKSGCTSCSTKTTKSDCDKFVDCKWVSPAVGFPGTCEAISGSTNPCSIGLNWCPDGTCQSNCVGHGKSGTGGTTDEDARQISLTYSEIDTATSQALLKASCTLSEQCDLNKCESLQSLVEKDVITDIQAIDISKKVSGELKKAIGSIGAGATAGTVCVALLAGGVTIPVAVPACLVTGGIAAFGIWDLVTSIDAGNKEKLGLCIKKESGGFCWSFADSLLNKFTKTNDCQTNTIIFVIAVFMLMMIVMKMMNQ